MGTRFLNAMTNSLDHLPEDGWCSRCYGCKHAAYILCTMFRWLGQRGSVIPYNPRYDYQLRSFNDNKFKITKES